MTNTCQTWLFKNIKYMDCVEAAPSLADEASMYTQKRRNVLFNFGNFRVKYKLFFKCQRVLLIYFIRECFSISNAFQCFYLG